MELNNFHVASVIHEANRQFRLVLGQTPGPHWAEADANLKASAIHGVEKALTGISDEELHEEWVRYKAAQGWQYGPMKDPVKLTHPCMVPYADLPEEERRKDRLFRAVVSALLDAPEPPEEHFPNPFRVRRPEAADSDVCQEPQCGPDWCPRGPRCRAVE